MSEEPERTMGISTIVVGVDQSAVAAEAVRWAAAEADLHGARLTAVLAWGLLDQHQTVVGERFDPSYGAGDAEEALRTSITEVIGADRAAKVHTLAVCDLPGRALVDSAQDADLLVVGARGLGGFRGLLLGSVSRHCLHHATVPTAVIRSSADRTGTGTASGPPRVVVGVDGSEGAQDALRWALREAGQRGAQLDVVCAWQLPPSGGLPSMAASDPIVHERAVAHVIDEALSAEAPLGCADSIVRRPIAGHPAQVLVEASAGADLLVVGSRGLGGLKRALLGSVADHVAHHASCPVVVVPSRRDEGRTER